MNLKEIPAENRPRERLQQQSSSSLSTSELLALILKSGTKQENIMDMCNKLLSKYDLEQLSHCSLQELEQEHGIGKAKASQLLALFELARRIPAQNKNQVTISRAQDVVNLYHNKLQQLQQEHFLAVYLDTKNKIIADQTITIGTLNSCLIHPREVFRGALKNAAHSLIVIHNHPSGDSTPSAEDREITQRLEKTGEIMGIPLLDHLIIGKNGWWSWKEKK